MIPMILAAAVSGICALPSYLSRSAQAQRKAEKDSQRKAQQLQEILQSENNGGKDEILNAAFQRDRKKSSFAFKKSLRAKRAMTPEPYAAAMVAAATPAVPQISEDNDVGANSANSANVEHTAQAAPVIPVAPVAQETKVVTKAEPPKAKAKAQTQAKTIAQAQTKGKVAKRAKTDMPMYSEHNLVYSSGDQRYSYVCNAMEQALAKAHINKDDFKQYEEPEAPVLDAVAAEEIEAKVDFAAEVEAELTAEATADAPATDAHELNDVTELAPQKEVAAEAEPSVVAAVEVLAPVVEAEQPKVKVKAKASAPAKVVKRSKPEMPVYSEHNLVYSSGDQRFSYVCNAMEQALAKAHINKDDFKQYEEPVAPVLDAAAFEEIEAKTELTAEATADASTTEAYELNDATELAPQEVVAAEAEPSVVAAAEVLPPVVEAEQPKVQAKAKTPVQAKAVKRSKPEMPVNPEYNFVYTSGDQRYSYVCNAMEQALAKAHINKDDFKQYEEPEAPVLDAVAAEEIEAKVDFAAEVEAELTAEATAYAPATEAHELNDVTELAPQEIVAAEAEPSVVAAAEVLPPVVEAEQPKVQAKAKTPVQAKAVKRSKPEMPVNPEYNFVYTSDDQSYSCVSNAMEQALAKAHINKHDFKQYEEPVEPLEVEELEVEVLEAAMADTAVESDSLATIEVEAKVDVFADTETDTDVCADADADVDVYTDAEEPVVAEELNVVTEIAVNEVEVAVEQSEVELNEAVTEPSETIAATEMNVEAVDMLTAATEADAAAEAAVTADTDLDVALAALAATASAIEAADNDSVADTATVAEQHLDAATPQPEPEQMDAFGPESDPEFEYEAEAQESFTAAGSFALNINQVQAESMAMAQKLINNYPDQIREDDINFVTTVARVGCHDLTSIKKIYDSVMSRCQLLVV